MRRAYGSEPILFDSSPITTQPVRQNSIRHKRRLWVGLFGAVFLCIVAAGLFTAVLRKSSGMPADIQKASSFQLYQPTWLPAGYVMNTTSYDITSGVVTFSAQSGKQNLLFTEQAKPGGFNFESFYEDQMVKKKFVQTGAGRAVIGEFEGLQSASLVAGQTWVLVRAPSGLAIADFERLLKNVKAAD